MDAFASALALAACSGHEPAAVTAPSITVTTGSLTTYRFPESDLTAAHHRCGSLA